MYSTIYSRRRWLLILLLVLLLAQLSAETIFMGRLVLQATGMIPSDSPVLRIDVVRSYCAAFYSGFLGVHAEIDHLQALGVLGARDNI